MRVVLLRAKIASSFQEFLLRSTGGVFPGPIRIRSKKETGGVLLALSLRCSGERFVPGLRQTKSKPREGAKNGKRKLRKESGLSGRFQIIEN